MKTSALGELIGRLGLLWLDHKPFSKESRARRKAKRAARKKARRGETLTPEEVAIMTTETEPTLRTSTKSGGTMGAGTAIIALVGVFFPDLMDNMSPETVAILASALTAGIGWLVARFSATPKNPGLL